MIIKITTIGASHGGNAINYAMNKDKKEGGKGGLKPEEQPFILASHGISTENYITGEPDANDVWLSMKLQQAKSVHHIKDGFFRVEICPSKEECQGWKPSDWRKMLDDAIKHIDGTDFKNKKGEVVGKHADFAHSQWVAAIHRDTDNWHIHLIVNRITLNDELQDANKIRERGIMAANNLAIERGWIKAEDKHGKRKAIIHADALSVLRNMKAFDFEEYFRLMRLKGWIVDAKYDSKGICRGYAIGEDVFKKTGGKSSTVMFQSSKLGFGRDLMVSKLQATWQKLHVMEEKQTRTDNMQNVSSIDSSIRQRDILHSVGDGLSNQSREKVQIPKWHCSTYNARENWNEEVRNACIPDVAYSMLDDMIKPLNRLDYWDKDEDIPGKAVMMAVAIFEFASATNAVSPSGGGGGPTNNDLRWDGMTKDDFEKMADMAMKKAMEKCTAHLSKRNRSYHR